MALQYPRIPLLAYADRLSARPGESVEFKVSSDGPEPFAVRLTRSISADPNPAGQGIVEAPVDADFAPGYPSRRQSFNPGSYAVVPRGPAVSGAFTLKVTVWPTRPGEGEQVILSAGGVELALDADGAPVARLSNGVLASGTPLKARQWYTLELTHDPADGRTATLAQAHHSHALQK